MLAPIRLTNAAAQLVLRTQVRRKEKHPHHPSAPLPPLRGSQIRIRQDAHRKPSIPPMLGLGEERYKMHALRDWLPIEGA